MKFRLVEQGEEQGKTIQTIGDSIKEVEKDAVEDGVSKEDAKELGAEVKQAQQELETEGPIIWLDEDEMGKIEKILSKALRTALRDFKRGEETHANVMLIGPGGVGKSSRTRNWAEAHKINLVEINAKNLDVTDMGGIVVRDKNNENVATKLASTVFDKLDTPNSVLFLDEYNRAPKDIRGTLLELVQSHIIDDNREPTGKRKLKGYLFTIGAINPPNGAYNTTALDNAERSRFRMKNIEGSFEDTLNYFTKTFSKHRDMCLEEGDEIEAKRNEIRLRLAKCILSSPKFHFSTPEEEQSASAEDSVSGVTNPRSLMNLLGNVEGIERPQDARDLEGAMDNAIEEVLDMWPDFCYAPQVDDIADILEEIDYIDASDNMEDNAAAVFAEYGDDDMDDLTAPGFGEEGYKPGDVKSMMRDIDEM